MILRGKFYCIMHQKYVLECANENSVCVCVCVHVWLLVKISSVHECVSVWFSLWSQNYNAHFDRIYSCLQILYLQEQKLCLFSNIAQTNT